jgi:hypothetical protein
MQIANLNINYKYLIVNITVRLLENIKIHGNEWTHIGSVLQVNWYSYDMELCQTNQKLVHNFDAFDLNSAVIKNLYTARSILMWPGKWAQLIRVVVNDQIHKNIHQGQWVLQ